MRTLSKVKRGPKKVPAFGLDMHTVAKGRKELCSGEIETDRVRRVGGGRKFLEKKRHKSLRVATRQRFVLIAHVDRESSCRKI